MKRIIEKTGGTIGKSWHDHSADMEKGQMQGSFRRLAGYVGDTEEQKYKVAFLGWQPTCKCNADAIPCVVLDPFGGSGTTAKVARDLKRDSIMIELNPAYVKIMRNKLRLNEQLVF
jgi:hypothetical protein